jgi:hypothetical protein
MAKRGFRARYQTARTALVHRARRHGTEGIKTLAIGAVVGAISEKVVTFAAQKSETVAKNWYGTPAVLAVGAYVAAKKFPRYAQALAGAAGFAAMYSYDMTHGSQAPKVATTGPEEAINF